MKARKCKTQKLVLNKECLRVLADESGKMVAGGWEWTDIFTCLCDPCAQQTLAESGCIQGPSFNYGC